MIAMGGGAPKPWATDKTVDTPFVSVPGLLTAECKTNEFATYLEIKVNGDPADPRVDDITGDLGAAAKPLAQLGPAPDRRESRDGQPARSRRGSSRRLIDRASAARTPPGWSRRRGPAGLSDDVLTMEAIPFGILHRHRRRTAAVEIQRVEDAEVANQHDRHFISVIPSLPPRTSTVKTSASADPATVRSPFAPSSHPPTPWRSSIVRPAWIELGVEVVVVAIGGHGGGAVGHDL